jgi:hypothetical protein
LQRESEDEGKNRVLYDSMTAVKFNPEVVLLLLTAVIT